MSLGVLNNLPAVYAENNLNNSNSSLTTVLQQLSSGSKINSGADDAAGLSLVDGLQANQTALTQSVTNAKEGVGLLQVADGALSQVTSLLNRAVTLAAEASNGTLNSSQDTAANQEYQSILSEISNIGSTTTYNGEQVFNSNTNIYTGDASMAGSSIDALNIRSLSSSNVGDTGGVMAYSNGQNNVFINLSTSGRNAQATDTLNAASGTTTIDVNYLVKGANGAESTATTSISVGTGTSFANTANGLISAINSAGLGLTASFTTQAEAGISGGGTQTGIQITGGLVSAGVDPGAASTSGTLNPAGITAQELTLGQTVTVKVGGVTAAAVTIGSSTSTLTGLMNAINANAGGAAGLVTASIVTNGNGSQSLALADTAGGGALTVTTASNPLGPNSLTNGTNSINPVTLSFNGSAYTTGATGINELYSAITGYNQNSNG
jgi:flagellin